MGDILALYDDLQKAGVNFLHMGYGRLTGSDR